MSARLEMRQAWRSRLWRKHAWVMGTLAALGTLGFGAAELTVSVNEARVQAGRLQLAQATEVAQAVRFELLNIDRHVGAVTALPWAQDAWLGQATRREEYGRLLRLVPAIESVALLDADGGERLFVSRREVDRMDGGPPARAPAAAASASAAPATTARSHAGTVSYRDNHDPVLDFALEHAEPRVGARTVVRVNLRALALALRSSLEREGSQVYVLDGTGTVVLHRDDEVMLARTRVPVVPAGAGHATGPAQPARGLDGSEVLRSSTTLDDVGWQVVVEQPRDVVMAPVWATLRRTLLFLGLGLALALGAALHLAGRTTRPIRTLHQAAQRLGGGQLDTSIRIRTGDELEELAEQFNRMAQRVQASVTDLEARVAARTQDLQRANLHKSEFLANMSHELRTPLNAILGFADVLREGMAGPLGDEQREYVADIHSSGLHLLDLINDVLDLSKIEAGQLALELSDFDVGETVAAAAALVRQRALRKGVALQATLAPEVGSWRGDARRIKQVLVNLLGNAVKFTPQGGRIEVVATLDDDEGLCFEVRDSGIGIAPGDHETVFEAFRQVGADSAGHAEGTGLGLALVRKLVTQHGGRVGLRSALGEGATFRFNIPRSLP